MSPNQRGRGQPTNTTEKAGQSISINHSINPGTHRMPRSTRGRTTRPPGSSPSVGGPRQACAVVCQPTKSRDRSMAMDESIDRSIEERVSSWVARLCPRSAIRYSRHPPACWCSNTKPEEDPSVGQVAHRNLPRAPGDVAQRVRHGRASPMIRRPCCTGWLWLERADGRTNAARHRATRRARCAAPARRPALFLQPPRTRTHCDGGFPNGAHPAAARGRAHRASRARAEGLRTPTHAARGGCRRGCTGRWCTPRGARRAARCRGVLRGGVLPGADN